MQATVFQVPTYNRFGILDKSNESENVYENTTKNNEIKKKVIPPIVVTQSIGNYREFIQRSKEILESSDFTCQFNNRQTKIYIKNEEHRRIIIRELEKDKVDFHTYTRRDEKLKKIVLKAAPGLNLDEFKEELEFEGVPVVEVIKLRIPTYNRFGILDRSNESEIVYKNTSKNQETKKKTIPPIVVTQPIGNYREFILRIKEILESSDFTCHRQRKIYIKNEEHRQIIINELEKDKVDFHTYTRREEKLKKK
ncbi:unnamed protein product [Psylliodes chrysocephalus]|uniref:Uncharacterized protein n=1 Tax=Psylliodes chrysocephalus TaxID=3402493 RepID=A0A9P0CSN7_9CUCU|nr:unnamed protein product [Psylliodes chrysocephala]